MQELIDGIVSSIDVERLNTNQKLKFLQISLQYAIPRLKHSTEDVKQKEPSVVDINIVETRDELYRLNKVRAYEEEHKVKIL